MYNLNLLENEEVILIVDKVLVETDNYSKFNSVALTNQRILLLDNFDEVSEVLRVSRGVSGLSTMDIYYSFNLSDIKEIKEYNILLNNNKTFVINNEDVISKIIN